MQRQLNTMIDKLEFMTTKLGGKIEDEKDQIEGMSSGKHFCMKILDLINFGYNPYEI